MRYAHTALERHLLICCADVSCPSDLAAAPNTTWADSEIICQAVITTYPGYYGRRRSVHGVVTVSNSVSNPGALSLEYALSGLPADSSAGLHIHAGHTCSDATHVGRHYYTPNDNGAPDPWNSTYTRTSAAGATEGSFDLACGFGLEPAAPTVRGHAVVVHSSGIALEPTDRIGCGVITCSRTDVPRVLCSGSENGQCNEEGRCMCKNGHWKEVTLIEQSESVNEQMRVVTGLLWHLSNRCCWQLVWWTRQLLADRWTLQL